MSVLFFALGVASTVYFVAAGVSTFWIAVHVLLDAIALVIAIKSLK